MLCPICKKAVAELDDPASPNRFFPFCSERCKLIDLGRWLDGRYRIPIKPADESCELPPPSSGDRP
ncbi:MAG: DNA gyrase inhibitor YacG [Tepidisphaeraceae bacterium]